MTEKVTDRPAPVALHPADVFRAKQSGNRSGGQFEVRRGPRSRVRAMRRWVVLAVLLSFLPLLVVASRAEPNYVLRAVAIIGLIVAIIAAGALLLVAWFAPIERSGLIVAFDDDVLTVGDAAAPHTAAFDWQQVRRCEVVGGFAPSLILTVAAPKPVDDAAPDPAPTDLAGDPGAIPDQDEPAELGPTPPFELPSKEAFDAITFAPEETEESASSTESAASSPADERADDRPSPESSRSAPWNTRFYGTPYVVSLWGADRSRAEIESAITLYSEGRFIPKEPKRRRAAGRS